MIQVTGWLFDIYARSDKGIALWRLGRKADGLAT